MPFLDPRLVRWLWHLYREYFHGSVDGIIEWRWAGNELEVMGPCTKWSVPQGAEVWQEEGLLNAGSTRTKNKFSETGMKGPGRF